MKDPETAEEKSKDKLNLYFSSYGHFCSKNCRFSMNFHDDSKNKNRKLIFPIFNFSDQRHVL